MKERLTDVQQNDSDILNKEISLNLDRNKLLKQTYKEIEEDLYINIIKNRKLLGKDEFENEYYVKIFL